MELINTTPITGVAELDGLDISQRYVAMYSAGGVAKIKIQKLATLTSPMPAVA